MIFISTCWEEHGPNIDAKGTRDTEGVNAATMDMGRSGIELYMKETEITQHSETSP